MHMLQLTLTTVMRILTKKITTNRLYRVEAQMAAYLNVAMREAGLTCSYFSDYQFEALMKPAKGYVNSHGSDCFDL